MRLEVRRCGGCRATILWALTANGQRMPVDFSPNEEGNLRLTLNTTAGSIGFVRATVLTDEEDWAAGEKRYTAHRATCSSAASLFRRKITEDRVLS